MDFKATSWFERNYKNILTVIVIFVSIGAVFYYFSLQDKSDTGKATFFRQIYSEQEYTCGVNNFV